MFHGNLLFQKWSASLICLTITSMKWQSQCLNPGEMDELKEIIEALLKFRNDSDWEQFHNPQDLALAISIESGELLELFLWKNAYDANKEKVKEELADILTFAFLLANKYDFDIKQIM